VYFLQRPTQAAGMPELWRISPLSSMRPRDIMLVTDFDGTLAEIASDPTEAHIVPLSLAALRRLSVLLRCVAVLSSRPLGDLERMVPLRGIELIGDSGMADITADERARLDLFNVKAAQLLSGFAGVWLEIKPGGTAVHHRHAEVDPGALLALITPLLQSTHLRAQPGRRVIEVIPRDHPKGDALAALVQRRLPEGIICLGDDENDRPMFDYLGRLGRPHLTVGVASNEARADLFAGCDLVVSGPEEVSRLLTLLAEWATTV
jgi:trehalose 6-phosphate phosphatase